MKAPAMHSVSGSIISVQIGRIAPLGPGGVASGFVKRPVEGPVMAGRFGLVGDEQADRAVHGGPEKAVYCYPVEHYASWRRVMPEHAALLVPGGFGENLTTDGLDEDRIAIGDIFRIGLATLQVSQPRQPCLKLALRFADRQIVRAMVRSGFCGWYLRVLEPGLIGAGSSATLLDRLNPRWSIARLNRLINQGDGTPEEMAELADLPGLAQHWRKATRASLDERTRRYGQNIAAGPAEGRVPAVRARESGSKCDDASRTLA
jgi:MOSC domain-containing protein YiiM